MFGKSPREPQKPTMSDLKDIELSPPPAINLKSPQDTLLQTENVVVEQNELVSTVEKISRIVSPYFVAVVGLSLYENNFLIGTVLILVGILSLLKVSTKDVGDFLEWLKNFLGLGK
ncbi:hypothetical protein I4641_15945 [Waterburya agarophytonicola K14]|uniref:Uncharacterized protein n=1 Tax=Waterburya agarophytonicola KI4 TaxID=2874699 RepID=A0A964FIH2_9CYAN|nr:hypothetical protein [Waterburya agarophytonicola]MCC0178469.1 hypothetical protein [Waterburya agarophytonicola KI4]